METGTDRDRLGWLRSEDKFCGNRWGSRLEYGKGPKMTQMGRGRWPQAATHLQAAAVFLCPLTL